jgi:transposase-like protein
LIEKKGTQEAEGMAQQDGMTMLEFMKRFGTEEACQAYLYEKRWPAGFVCPKCGAQGEPFQITSRKLYQGKQCNHQTSVTAGTVMDKSRTPLQKWFLAIYLMSKDKRGCSAMQLKRELQIAYDTAWTISHKIRKAMGDRDENYLLSGIVEMDEGFFGAPSEGEGKRGRGTDKTPVVIGLSLVNGQPGFVKAQVLPAVNGDSIAAFAEKNIEKGTSVSSDSYRIYRKLEEKGYIHTPENFDPNENPEHLKWLHIIISNLKIFLNGTYHGIGSRHMQPFLDEYCFRFNRRFWQDQLFSRTLSACAACSAFTRNSLIMS